MNRTLLAATFVVVSLATPALARNDRLVRVCDERGVCQRVPQARVRTALIAVSGPLPPSSEPTASAAANRRQLSALLARLR